MSKRYAYGIMPANKHNTTYISVT